LRAATVETDCDVELYGVQLIFFVLLTLYYAVVVNLGSTLLANGIRNLNWRRLCPEGIPFRSKIREDGSLAQGADQNHRARRISAAMSRYEAAGRLQIAAAAFLCLVWVIILLS